MTYPIQPGPFFLGSTKLGKARQTLSLAQKLSNWTDVLLSALIAAARIHEENHLIYRPLESSLLDQGFPVEYEFNMPHTGTTLSHLQLWLSTATQNSALTSSYFIPGQHYLKTCLSPTTARTTHSWVTISFLSLTSKHDFCYTYGDYISLAHSTMP